MVQALEAARWVVVEKLQRRVFSGDPCSFGSAIADHAVGLVLSPDRPADSYLAHNARRDARKVVIARLRRSRARDVSFIETERMTASQSADHSACTYEGLVSYSEPAVLWQEVFDQLRIAAAHRNRFAAACLDHWRDGGEDQETADALGISLGYVKKLKRLIRQIASEILPEAVRT